MKRFVLPAFGLAVLCAIVGIALPTFEDVPGCIRSNVWPASLIKLHVTSDALIAVAYTWIPVTLVYILVKRKDIPIDWILLAFAGFIVFCGLTHVMGAFTVWRPIYWLAGEIKAATALVSITTAVLLQFNVMPKLLAIPHVDAVREANAALKSANEELETKAAELEAAVEREAKGAQALRDQIAVVERQKRVIRGLSVPTLEAWDRIIVTPLVGTVDSERAAMAMESLLATLSRSAARFAIVDLTGVDAVDTATAGHLIKMVEAARLLGTETVLTGIQPVVAATMVSLGVNLTAIKTLRTLRDGLRWSTDQLEAEDAARAAAKGARALSVRV